MRSFPILASTALVSVFVLPLVMPSCGGNTTTPPTPTGSGGSSGTAGGSTSGTSGSSQQGGTAGTMMTIETCVANEDCQWGEISREIAMASDCPCLYGCSFLPQTKVTVARRAAQYKALCNPQTNGKGQQCGIDDCAGPGAIACIEGVCKAAPRDGGLIQ